MIRRFSVICQVDVQVEVDDSDVTEDENIESIASFQAEIQLGLFRDYMICSIEEI